MGLEEAKRVRDKVAIVGVGTTRQGTIPDKDGNEIAVDAFKLALDDAGLKKEDIDGLITCKSFGGLGIDTQIAHLLGMNPRYSATLDYGTCNFSLHLATSVIMAGLADVVACVYGTNQRSNRNRFAGGREDSAAYGFFNIAGPAAMAFRRHMEVYGTTQQQLGAIAVAQRKHANLNPNAVMTGRPLSIEDYMASRYIVWPLHLYDICLITDGGSCFIVTSAERAKSMKKQPVYLMGMAENSGGLRDMQNPDNLMRPWIKEVAKQIYPAAGVTQKDIDALYIQDPTSIWPLQMIEWYGFCGEGEAGSFIQNGRIELGGELPLNTNGGQLSESYLWGWLHIPEAVRQLRGECGPRQINPRPEIAQYCSTMGFSKAASSILRR